MLQSANPGNEKPSRQRAGSAEFLGKKFCKPKNLSQKMRKDRVAKKLSPK
jgi:hypothetical protein